MCPWTELWKYKTQIRVSEQSVLLISIILYSVSFDQLQLKLKLQYFGHLMQRTDSITKDPDNLTLGKIEGKRRRGQRMRWLDGITDLMNMSWAISGSWWWTGKPGMLQSMWSQRVGHNWATEQQTCFRIHVKSFLMKNKSLGLKFLF